MNFIFKLTVINYHIALFSLKFNMSVKGIDGWHTYTPEQYAIAKNHHKYHPDQHDVGESEVE